MPNLLLADIEGLGVVIFLVVSFISWILNMKNDGNKKGNRPRPNRPRAGQAGAGAGQQARGAGKPDALKSELEAFLQEVTGQKQKPKPQNKPRPIPAKAPRKRIQPREQPAAVAREKPTRKRPKKAAPRPSSQRRQPKKELGSKLREHVDDYMGESRVEKHVEEHMTEGVSGRKDRRIGAHVRQHLGSSISGVPVQIEVDPKPANTAEIIEMLRDPNSVRNAVIINEILKKPRALRREGE